MRTLRLICCLILTVPLVNFAQTSKRDLALVASQERALNAIASIAERTNHLVIVELRVSGPYMLPKPVHLNERESSSDAVESLKALLDNSRFQIRTDRDGVIRVRENGADETVLGVQLKHLTFTEEGRFNPRTAMNEVFGAPEVQAYLQAHKMKLPIDIGGLVSPSDPALPHLEPAFDNMTVLEALKRILRVFPHTAAYRVSDDSSRFRWVSIGFWDSH
jgi:hypothetical protein